MHDNIARQVFIYFTQTVAEPGAEAGTTRNLAAGLDVCDGRVVVDGLGEGAIDNSQFLRHLGRVGQQFTDPDAAVVVFVLGESIFTWTNWQRLLTRGHAGNALPVTDVFRQILTKHLAHFRFVIPEIVMAWATAHEKIDHPLGLGCEVSALRLACGVGEQVRAKRVGQGGSTKAKRSAAKQLPARHHEFGFAKWIHVVHGVKFSCQNSIKAKSLARAVAAIWVHAAWSVMLSD